jgi:hypothetical protein
LIEFAAAASPEAGVPIFGFETVRRKFTPK